MLEQLKIKQRDNEPVTEFIARWRALTFACPQEVYSARAPQDVHEQLQAQLVVDTPAPNHSQHWKSSMEARHAVMITPATRWTLLATLISLLVSLRYPTRTGRTRMSTSYSMTLPSTSSSEWDRTKDMLSSVLLETSEEDSDSEADSGNQSHLEYDYYRETCPAALLRLTFHDCFIKVLTRWLTSFHFILIRGLVMLMK